MDICLLIGQSNAKGCGTPERSEVPVSGTWEYVENFTGCSLIPLGVTMQLSEGRGTLAPALCNRWKQLTGHDICMVHYAVDGSRIKNWQHDNAHYLESALNKLNHCREYVQQKGIPVEGVYTLWVQGESDGKYGTDIFYYEARLKELANTLLQAGVMQVFVSATGLWDCGEDCKERCRRISMVQELVCDEVEGMTLVSKSPRTYLQRGLQRDLVHYSMRALNLLGQEIAQNMVQFLQQGHLELDDPCDMMEVRRYIAQRRALEG